MAGKGGKREGAGRKPDAEAQKLRADLKSRLPKAMSAIDKILADPDHQQHVMIAKWVVDKLAANPKPESAAVHFELTGSTPAEHAQSVIVATSRGELSPSVATELLTAVASCMKILEVSELVERIEALESAKS